MDIQHILLYMLYVASSVNCTYVCTINLQNTAPNSISIFFVKYRYSVFMLANIQLSWACHKNTHNISFLVLFISLRCLCQALLCEQYVCTYMYVTSQTAINNNSSQAIVVGPLFMVSSSTSVRLDGSHRKDKVGKGSF